MQRSWVGKLAGNIPDQWNSWLNDFSDITKIFTMREKTIPLLLKTQKHVSKNAPTQWIR